MSSFKIKITEHDPRHADSDGSARRGALASDQCDGCIITDCDAFEAEAHRDPKAASRQKQEISPLSK